MNVSASLSERQPSTSGKATRIRQDHFHANAAMIWYTAAMVIAKCMVFIFEMLRAGGKDGVADGGDAVEDGGCGVNDVSPTGGLTRLQLSVNLIRVSAHCAAITPL